VSRVKPALLTMVGSQICENFLLPVGDGNRLLAEES
jgi:hypothetical protein